ncbi:RraA family protein [Variovorax boronicumulans]|uniref:RraA family protein n=1 Tax=Variovorax boronicumulans TaxID=436515 RepID=UPI001C55A389
MTPKPQEPKGPLSAELLAELATFDTPTICNALEVIAPERRSVGFTTEGLNCLYPELRPMVGYARTATMRSIHPLRQTPEEGGKRTMDYYTYIAEGGPRPSVCIIQDLDAGRAGFGSFWGEVNTTIHKGFGCQGVVTDGSVRDVDTNAPGFQMLCRMVVPSHAHYHIVDFGSTVSVAGAYIAHNDLVHADRHGAVVIPVEHAARIPEVVAALTRREAVIIAAARRPDFSIETLRRAVGDARNMH